MSILSIELAARRNNKPTFWELKGAEIKPCPFCGESDIHLVKDNEIHWCCCTTCGVEGPARSSRATAVQCWQKRKQEP